MRLPKIAWYAALAMLGSPVMAAPAAPEDEAALRSIVIAYEQAIRSGDVSKSGIRKSLATGFSAVLPSGQLMASYGDISKGENALRTMVGRGARYDTTEVIIDPAIDVSVDLAAFTGRTLNHATAQAGRDLTFTTHWSAVAKKEDGTWRLLRHQAVMDPSTNPWHQDGSSRPAWVWVVVSGLLGTVGGAVIGFAAARVLGRPGAPSGGRTLSTPDQPSGAAVPRARAWDKSTSGGSLATDAESAPGPTASERDIAAAEPEPPASRSGKKRAWED